MSDRRALANRALAFARYDEAAGLRSLVIGLVAAKPALDRKILTDPRIAIYPGGRMDIESGRVDVRVLVLVGYLAIIHREVTVSSLISGHRFFARPGVVSAHVFGRAVDISALGGTPIEGHEILLLPTEDRPRQVISLLGLGGPSFPLPDHSDHVHIGY